MFWLCPDLFSTVDSETEKCSRRADKHRRLTRSCVIDSAPNDVVRFTIVGYNDQGNMLLRDCRRQIDFIFDYPDSSFVISFRRLKGEHKV